MNTPAQPRLRLYALALHLYPSAFRHRYADEMLETARLEYARSPHPVRFAASLASDTLRSILREHLRAATPTGPSYVAAFAIFFTFLLVGISVVNQQILRRSADRQPAHLAHLGRTTGYYPALNVPSPSREISSPDWLNSTTPFVAFYDPTGKIIVTTALYHGGPPQPPQGIFDTIRSRREFRVTWQPAWPIRVALVGDALPNGGFVLAGQSLIPTEARYIRFHALLLWMWAFAMLACCFLALFARKRTRTPTA
jgi:hypothetical protein